MADDVLSQDELDALKDVASSTTGEQEGVSLYDFHQPVHILKTRLPAVEIVNDRFSKLLQVLLQSFANRNIGIINEDVEMLKYEDYLATLPNITHSIKCKMTPLNGSMLLVSHPELIYALVECYFGAKGDINIADQRDFTLTELGVVERFSTELIKQYSNAWDSIHSLYFDKLSSENRTQAISYIDGSDVVIVSKFVIEIENIKSAIHLVLPYAAFEPIKNLLISGIARQNVSSDDYWYKQLQQKMYEANIELRAVLSETDIPLSDLFTLKKGDFIPLKKHEKCAVYADDYRVFEGKVGVSNQVTAIRISGWHRH